MAALLPNIKPTTGKSVGKPRPACQPASLPAAYHREIGREATARNHCGHFRISAYHREIGREATAYVHRYVSAGVAYHREIGREATAHLIDLGHLGQAYHREIGREATARETRDRGQPTRVTTRVVRRCPESVNITATMGCRVFSSAISSSIRGRIMRLRRHL